jgi:hypothetical protein
VPGDSPARRDIRFAGLKQQSLTGVRAVEPRFHDVPRSAQVAGALQFKNEPGTVTHAATGRTGGWRHQDCGRMAEGELAQLRGYEANPLLLARRQISEPLNSRLFAHDVAA